MTARILAVNSDGY